MAKNSIIYKIFPIIIKTSLMLISDFRLILELMDFLLDCNSKINNINKNIKDTAYIIDDKIIGRPNIRAIIPVQKGIIINIKEKKYPNADM